MSREFDVIEAVRRANPVPPASVTDEVVPPLKDVLGSRLERSGAMSPITKERETPTKAVPRRVRYLGSAAVVVAVLGLAGSLVLSQRSGVDWGAVAPDQRAVVAQVTEAIENNDPDAFASAFGEGAVFATHLDFVDRSSCCDAYPVERGDLVTAWMAVNEAWGLESDLRSCEPEGDAAVRCSVRASWQNLQLEIRESWLFVFEGSELRSFGTLFDDLNPVERSMPLDFSGLEAWEAWLQERDPAEYERLLPYGEGFERVIDSVPFWSNILRYDPALATEIRASIDDYLATR